MRQVPERLAGVPIGLITAGILAMAFMGFAGLGGCARQDDGQRLTATFYAMGGIPVHVTTEGADRGTLEQAVEEYRTEIQALEAELSMHRANSALSRAAQSDGKPVALSMRSARLVEQALALAQETGGAFDPTIGPLVHLWRESLQASRIPADVAIRAARKTTGCHLVHLDRERDPPTLALDRGARLDLGGIAKGYAVDRSIALLQSLGIKHAIVTAGGDSRIIGDRMGRPWMVGIRDPRKSGAVSGVIPLTDSALSTSGDYERYFIEDGKHYHHILNPGTGDSARELRSVSVLGPDATTTDALSTSIFVLGLAKGMALVETLPDIETIIIDQAGKMHYSSGLLSTPERSSDTAKNINNN